jgi:6-phosphogluconolactonase (cycloisomerase 2 family)
MKFSRFGRATLAAVSSLGVAAAFNACGGPNGTNNTIDYVYVASSKSSPGQINAYYADSRSGALIQIPGSPFSSGGANPVSLVTSPNFENLYVVNRDDNTVVQFAIGADATISQKNKYTTPGSSPNSVAINSAGTLLFVTDTYQPTFSATNPGSGALVVYPINSDGSLGSPVANGALSYYPLGTATTNVLNPTAVTVLTQNPVNSTTTGSTYVYVVSQNATTGLGDISAFGVATGGALAPIACSASATICSTNSTGTVFDGTFSAGTAPNAIAATPRGLFLYVTDSVNNQLISYTVQSSGQIIPSQNGPTRTDVFPDSVVVDPRGEYVYVANYTASDISAYAINASTGYPTGVASAGTYATGTGPTCVFVEPALGQYVYTTNFLDNTVSGLSLNPNTGTLAAVQNNPFIAGGQPTCVSAVPHGNHPISTPTT